MKRLIDTASSIVLIVLTAPLLLLGWLGLRLRRTHPVLTRSDATPDFPSGILMFNSSGNDPFPAFLRTYSIDHLPVLFDVLAGSTRLSDVIGFARRCSEVPHRPSTRERLFLLGVLIAVAAVLALTFFSLSLEA